jgi:Zn finger protein HypA/HybF involved in hydrogenase expression
VAEYDCGLGWCSNCKQNVDVVSEDNKIFYCGFCGKKIKQISDKKGK